MLSIILFVERKLIVIKLINNLLLIFFVIVKQKLNDDSDDIMTTVLNASLTCPVGKIRMITPCRPSTCDHLQCFDASLFLQMNEKKATWICPVCDRPALYDNLMIDG